MGCRDGRVRPVRATTGPAGHSGVGVVVEFKVDERVRRRGIAAAESAAAADSDNIGYRRGADRRRGGGDPRYSRDMSAAVRQAADQELGR